MVGARHGAVMIRSGATRIHAAHRLDQSRVAIGIDLSPESRHLHVDDVVDGRRTTRLLQTSCASISRETTWP